jgi:PTS system glucitol/sorbitol-specific IIC component
MFVADMIQNIVNTGTNQLLTWMTQLLPQVFLFLIFMNAVTSMIGRARVERLAAKCGSNSVLRYMVLPFLSAVVLGNPMAISMGRYLPERYKPAYFASASYHCHTNSGIFQHINPAELFLWLGIANGVLARGFETFPLAIRYLIAGLIANFVSGLATEFITKRIEKKQNIRLEREVDLWTEQEVRADAVGEVNAHTSEMNAPTGEMNASAGEVNAPAGEVNASAGEAKAPAPLAPGQYRSIRIVCGDGGFGGPLVITPTPEKHTVIYMTGGNLEPEPLAKILALSGMRAINLSKDNCPDEEIALAIVDCGGTLRCGIYPKKGIPTVNIMATGKSGPLARYITEDIYVSAVTSAEVSLADGSMADAEEPLADGVMTQSEETLTNAGVTDAGMTESNRNLDESMDGDDTQKSAQARVESHLSQALTPVIAVSKVFSIFQQSARDAVRTCLEMILPFMGFAALFIGICRGSGLTEFLANLMKPMSASVLGLLAIGIICSIPGLSAVLGAGAAAAQVFAAVIGELIANGGISPALALPALFAINCQCACDFIPVGLGMTEAKKETTQVGIAAVTISRFTTGWIRILIALVCSIGLYA